jgi:hypothetical protein
MLIKIELDKETMGELVASAVRNLRTVDLEAHRLLRKALGLPVPWPTTAPTVPEQREVAECAEQ